MNASKTRILLIDDAIVLREPMSLDMTPRCHLRIVGARGDIGAAIREVESFSPHAVLIDIDRRCEHGFRVASSLRQRVPGLKIAFLATRFTGYTIHRALELEAAGCVIKSDPLPEIIDAVRDIAEGGRFFSPVVRSQLVIESSGVRLDPRHVSPVSDLTPRQHEVLRHLATGLSKKQIADRMHISEKTVGSHVEKLMARLDIHDRVGLARLAIREGVVEA